MRVMNSSYGSVSYGASSSNSSSACMDIMA